MKAYRIKVRRFIAKNHDLPRMFIGIVLRETAKAYQVFGHGTQGDLIQCCNCGRNLTHPVSRLVGIGPECGQHFWDESVLGSYGFTEEHVEELKKMVHEIKVGPLWVPKSCIESMEETAEEIEPPKQENANGSQQQSNGVGNQTIRANGEEVGQASGTPREAEASPRAEAGAGVGSGAGGKTATLTKEGIVEVRFKYDPDLVTTMRTMNLSTPKFEKTETDRWWNLVLDLGNVQRLLALGFLPSGDLKAWLARETAPRPSLEVSPSSGEPEWMKGLYDFQKTGVRWLDFRKGKGILGDEMGLGKTVQALAWLRLHPDTALPAVVVCPASLKFNWKKEATRWLNGSCITEVHGGKFPLPVSGGRKLHIINYDILPYWANALVSAGIKTVILDESHYIKNPKAKRSLAVKAVCKRAPHVICLTGTPIKNRPLEILEPVSLVMPSLFPRRFDFLKRYCDAKWNGYGWDFTGASNTEELHRKLTGSCMLRRLKKDVLKQLPPKVRTVVPLEIENMKAYEILEGEVVGSVKKALEDFGMDSDVSTSTANALAEIERLKQAAVRGKIDAAVEWISNFVEDGEKLVVFCHHQFTVDILMENFGAMAVKMDGRTSGASDVRQKIVEQFQTDPAVKIFVGTMAAKEGHTLTAASNTAFLELWWTPGDHDQAEDRVHRIGQEAESVGAYYLVAKGTIEETIARLIDSKRRVVASVLDGKTVKSESLLMELMKEMVSRASSLRQ